MISGGWRSLLRDLPVLRPSCEDHTQPYSAEMPLLVQSVSIAAAIPIIAQPRMQMQRRDWKARNIGCKQYRRDGPRGAAGGNRRELLAEQMPLERSLWECSFSAAGGPKPSWPEAKTVRSQMKGRRFGTEQRQVNKAEDPDEDRPDHRHALAADAV